MITIGMRIEQEYGKRSQRLSDLSRVADIHSGEPNEEDTMKYRTHATTKYEVELLFVVRNLTPKQRKEVMTLAKKLVSEGRAYPVFSTKEELEEALNADKKTENKTAF